MADAVNVVDILSANQQSALADQVTQAYKSGMAPEQIIGKLIQTPKIGAHIEDALVNGSDPDVLLSQFGGKALADFKANDPVEKIKAQSFLKNTWEGVKQGGTDLGHAVNQLALRAQAAGIGGVDQQDGPPVESLEQTQADAKAALVKAQAAEEQRQADPAYQAQANTVGGKIGSIGVKALPYVGAAALTDGASIPAMMAAQGGAGALEGALTPTTGEGQIGRNMLTNALVGAGTQGVLGVGGKLIKAGSGALGRAISGDPAVAHEMTAAGLTPTVGTTSPLARAAGNALSGSRDAMTQYGKEDLVKAALKPLGIAGESELTPEVLVKAEQNVWKGTNDLLKNTHIPSSPELTQKVTAVVQKYTADALPSTADKNVAGIAGDIIQKAQSGELTGPRAVDYLRQVRNLSYTATNAADRDAFKGLQQSLSDAIQQVSPDAAQSLAESNALHQKLLVLRDVAARAKGQNPTVQQFGVSNTKFAPKPGAAGPYQDLADAAAKAYGTPSGSTSRYGTLLAALGKLALPAGAAALGAEHHGIAGALIGTALEKGGEKLGGKMLANALNRPVSAAAQGTNQSVRSQKLRQALQMATQGGIAGSLSN